MGRARRPGLGIRVVGVESRIAEKRGHVRSLLVQLVPPYFRPKLCVDARHGCTVLALGFAHIVTRNPPEKLALHEVGKGPGTQKSNI